MSLIPHEQNKSSMYNYHISIISYVYSHHALEEDILLNSDSRKVVSSLQNPEIHKALQGVSEKFNISMLQLRDTIDELLKEHSSLTPFEYEQDVIRTPLDEINTAIIKNREIINKNRETLNKN